MTGLVDVNRHLLMLMLFLSASFMIGVAAYGQDEKGPDEAQAEETDSPQKKMLEQAMKRQMDRMKKKYEAKMAVRIQEMTEVCRLTEQQARQLRLAAKGSIVKALEDQKQQMEEMQARFNQDGMNMDFVVGQPMIADVAVEAVEAAAPVAAGEDVVPAAPAAPVAPVVEGAATKPAEAGEPAEADAPRAEAAEPAAPMPAEMPAVEVVGRAMAVDFAMAMPFMGNEQEQNTPWKQPVWLETVKGTLTEEQVKTLEAFEKERTLRTQKAMIQSYVQTIDTELHLNATQRTDLAAWMEKDFASYFTDPNVSYMFSNSMFMEDSIFVEVDDGTPQPVGEPEHFKVVSKILTPEQMELWKGGYAETFRALENMKNDEPDEPGFQIQQILAPFR